MQLLDSGIDVSVRIEVLKTIRNLSFAPESRAEIKKYELVDFTSDSHIISTLKVQWIGRDSTSS